jgi:hypothetical protein
MPAMRASSCVALLFPTILAACTSALESPLTVFADPGRYEFYNCEQLAQQRAKVKAREQELKQLMDRAEQGTGGAFVNVIAYKGDYVAVTEELQVIDMTLRVKKCPTPENWRSNSAVR